MKRVFIPLMILIMASTAGAALQISVDGDLDPLDSYITIMPSDHFSLGIWTDADITQGSPLDDEFIALVVDISLGFIDYTTGSSPIPGLYLEHSMSAAAAGFPLPPYEDGIMGYITLVEAGQIDAGTVLFDFIDYHCLTIGDAQIKLYTSPDGVEASLVDTVIVHQIVPEPMTIGLLGLGALLLRKRKI